MHIIHTIIYILIIFCFYFNSSDIRSKPLTTNWVHRSHRVRNGSYINVFVTICLCVLLYFNYNLHRMVQDVMNPYRQCLNSTTVNYFQQSCASSNLTACGFNRRMAMYYIYAYKFIKISIKNY